MYLRYNAYMKSIEALISLGLNEKEAKAYLALLPLAKATAYTIAMRSGLKKPTAHVVLDNLVSKGFALKIPYKRKHCFMAKSPRECLSLIKKKIATAEEMLPELLAIQKQMKKRPASLTMKDLMELKKCTVNLSKL